MCARLQERVETVLNGNEPGRCGDARKDGGVVVALGAEQDGAASGRLPIGEGDERGWLRRQTVHNNAVPAPPVDLGEIGVHERDGYAGRTQGMTDGTADAAGTDDVDRIHAIPSCLTANRWRARDSARLRLAAKPCYFFVYSFKYPWNCWRWPSSSANSVMARSWVT